MGQAFTPRRPRNAARPDQQPASIPPSLAEWGSLVFMPAIVALQATHQCFTCAWTCKGHCPSCQARALGRVAAAPDPLFTLDQQASAF